MADKLEVYLNVDKAVWDIKGTEIPVIENVPMKDLRWFTTKTSEIEKLRKKDQLTPEKAIDIDDEWWTKICEIGLGKTMDEVLDLGLTEPEFRSLTQEVFHFLKVLGNVNEAKQSAIYNPEIQDSEDKP